MTSDHDPETGRFKPGNTGCGGGRPKGARNKLAGQFLDDLQALWQEEGADVLREARAEKPMEFAKMVASILPRELLVRRAPEDDMTDDELADAIDQLATLAARLRDGDAGAGQTHAGTDTPQ